MMPVGISTVSIPRNSRYSDPVGDIMPFTPDFGIILASGIVHKPTSTERIMKRTIFQPARTPRGPMKMLCNADGSGGGGGTEVASALGSIGSMGGSGESISARSREFETAYC